MAKPLGARNSSKPMLKPYLYFLSVFWNPSIQSRGLRGLFLIVDFNKQIMLARRVFVFIAPASACKAQQTLAARSR
jgi:hypothetical protein